MPYTVKTLCHQLAINAILLLQALTPKGHTLQPCAGRSSYIYEKDCDYEHNLSAEAMLGSTNGLCYRTYRIAALCFCTKNKEINTSISTGSEQSLFQLFQVLGSDGRVDLGELQEKRIIAE